MGFRLFKTGRKAANSHFLCPLLTYLNKTAVVTCRTERFLAGVGSGGWNLKQKMFCWYSALILLQLLSILVCFNESVHLCSYYLLAFGRIKQWPNIFFCFIVFVLLWASIYNNNEILLFPRNILPNISIKIVRPALSIEV